MIYCILMRFEVFWFVKGTKETKSILIAIGLGSGLLDRESQRECVYVCVSEGDRVNPLGLSD